MIYSRTHSDGHEFKSLPVVPVDADFPSCLCGGFGHLGCPPPNVFQEARPPLLFVDLSRHTMSGGRGGEGPVATSARALTYWFQVGQLPYFGTKFWKFFRVVSRLFSAQLELFQRSFFLEEAAQKPETSSLVCLRQRKSTDFEGSTCACKLCAWTQRPAMSEHVFLVNVFPSW